MDVGGSSIPSGGPPLSFISGSSNVPSNGPGPEYGRKIKATSIGGGSHTHAPNGEWQITKDYFVTPMPKLEYHLKLTDNQLLWYSRSSRATTQQVGRISEVFLNLFCFNDVLRRGWLLALTHLEPLVELHQGTLNPNDDVEQAADNRNAFLNFLSKPELQWSRLFSDKSPISQRNDAYQAMQWLALEGILTRYTPAGCVLVQPQIQYGPTELPRKRSRMQMTVQFEGVAILKNVWGKRACQGAFLFLIVRRVIDPRTGHFGQFACVPYANLEKTVPLRELEYKDVSGNTAYAAAYLVARVIDVLGTGAEGDELDLIQGLRGTVDESLRATNNAANLKVLLVSAERMY
jgi:hypothetical protein